MIRLIREQIPIGGVEVDCMATGFVAKREGGKAVIRVEGDDLTDIPQAKCRGFWVEWQMEAAKGDRVCVGYNCTGIGLEPQVRVVQKGACFSDLCKPVDREGPGLVPLEVDHVFDGDTFRGILQTEGPRTTPEGTTDPTRTIVVRIAGIDTPEDDECGYDAATAAAEQLLGARAWIDPGPIMATTYQRLVAEVFLDESGTTSFGEEMVRQGWAHPLQGSPVSPEEARTKSGGVWDLCPPEDNPFIEKPNA